MTTTLTETATQTILLYTDGELSTISPYSGVKEQLVKCVGVERYVIQEIKMTLPSSGWQHSCALVVVATGEVPEHVEDVLTKFLDAGGRILSLCCNFDKRYFGHKVNRNSKEVVEVEYEEKLMKAVAGEYHYVGTKAEESLLQTHESHMVVAAESSNSSHGKCVCTQVHLYGCTESSAVGVGAETPSTSTESEGLRLQAFADLLLRLNIDVCDDYIPRGVTLCHFRCAQGQEMLSEFMRNISLQYKDGIERNVLTLPEIGRVNLVSNMEESLHSFDWTKYKSALTSKLIGNTVIYQKIAYTTMNNLDPFIACVPVGCGLVAVASRQLNGRGRAGNTWLSPPGCMMLTMHMVTQTGTPLGDAVYSAARDVLPAIPESGASYPAVSVANILTTLPAVSVARLINFYLREHTGAKEDYRSVRVKWPNDIFYSNTKVGGVLVDLRAERQGHSLKIHAYVGIGVNVTNQKPTLNLNDVITDFNTANSTNIPLLSIEYVAARVTSEVELLLDMYDRDYSLYLAEYEKYWMHSGEVVDVKTEDSEIKGVSVAGVDKFGYLKLLKEDGATLTVPPEGYSYNICDKIVKPKP